MLWNNPRYAKPKYSGDNLDVSCLISYSLIERTKLFNIHRKIMVYQITAFRIFYHNYSTKNQLFFIVSLRERERKLILVQSLRKLFSELTFVCKPSKDSLAITKLKPSEYKIGVMFTRPLFTISFSYTINNIGPNREPWGTL